MLCVCVGWLCVCQTKQAMTTILGDLREGDHFNIITFSDTVHTWRKDRTVRATRQNVRHAKDFVRRIIAEGCELCGLRRDHV